MAKPITIVCGESIEESDSSRLKYAIDVIRGGVAGEALLADSMAPTNGIGFRQ